MISYIDQLENLDVVFGKNLAMDLVLGSLPSSYGNFIVSYHLDSVDKTLIELYNILQIVEFRMKKVHATSQS